MLFRSRPKRVVVLGDGLHDAVELTGKRDLLLLDPPQRDPIFRCRSLPLLHDRSHRGLRRRQVAQVSQHVGFGGKGRVGRHVRSVARCRRRREIVCGWVDGATDSGYGGWVTGDDTMKKIVNNILGVAIVTGLVLPFALWMAL